MKSLDSRFLEMVNGSDDRNRLDAPPALSLPLRGRCPVRTLGEEGMEKPSGYHAGIESCDIPSQSALGLPAPPEGEPWIEVLRKLE